MSFTSLTRPSLRYVPYGTFSKFRAIKIKRNVPRGTFLEEIRRKTQLGD
jgi:hypothetical protein